MSPRLLSVDEARARVLGAIRWPLPAEILPVGEALGRVLAGPVVAETDLPPWDNSAMDGYAVLASDVVLASEEAPLLLPIVGEVAAGARAEVTLRPGTAVRIATGAPLPPGADAVVPVEDTTPLDAAGLPSGGRGGAAIGPLPAGCLVHAAVAPGANVRRRADDLAAGTVILPSGRALGPVEMALVAGAGVGRVAVHRRPRVAVISTGDELRPAGGPLGPAGIPDANGPGLVALATAAGAEARHLGIAPDNLGAVVATLRVAIAEADLVLVSGGVSVGPYDVVRTAFEEIGSVELWRVAVQPGKPFAFGVAPRADTGPADAGAATEGAGAEGAAAEGAGPGQPSGPQPGGPPVFLFGLPGNPVSVFVTFELFVRPALRRLSGRPDADLLRPVARAVLAESVSKAPGRRGFLRVVAERDGPFGAVRRDGAGRAIVRTAGGQGSHVLSALAAADALAIVPESADSLPAGAEVELWWLDRA